MKVSIAMSRPIIILKKADEIVNNSTTLQNDDELFLPIGANEMLEVVLTLLYSSLTIYADMRNGWGYPSGCSINWGAYTNEWYGANMLKETDYDVGYTANGDVLKGIQYLAVVINGSTPGILHYMWAQNTARVENTKVLKNSYLIATRLN